MMPRRNDKMFFWHIPKTGGSWVIEALSRRRACAGMSRVPSSRSLGFRVKPESNRLMLFGHHAPPCQVAEEFKRDRFHFCFVRRPVDWYISWWGYRIRRGKSDKRHYLDRYHRDSCDEFVNVALDNHPGYLTELLQVYVGPYADQMDYIGRTENLVTDLRVICSRAGQPIKHPFDDLPQRNKAASLPEIAPRAFVTPETAERVNAIEHWVLEKFYDCG